MPNPNFNAGFGYDSGYLYDTVYPYDFAYTSPITVVINSIDQSYFVEASSFQIDQVLTRRGDSAKLTILDTGNVLVIARFASVLVSDDSGHTLFSGWVTKQRTRTRSAAQRQIDLTCQDATLFLQARGANKYYTNWYVTDIVRDLVLNASPSVGITCTNTPAASGPQITFAASQATIAATLDRLAKVASTSLASTSGGVYDWYVDYASDLHFFTASSAPVSTVVLTDENGLTVPVTYANPGIGYDARFPYDADTPGTQLNYARDTFSHEVDDTQLGNSVLVRGAQILSLPVTDSFVSDGTNSGFRLSQAPDITLGGMPVVTVGGVTQTVAQGTVGTTPTTQWVVAAYYGVASWTLYTGTAAVPGLGVAITCTYAFDLPAFSRATNAADIAALAALPNAGTFERIIQDTSIASQSAAVARANAELAAYGQSYENVQVETQLVTTGAVLGDLAAGKQVQIINSQLGLNTTMLCIKLTIRSRGPTAYYYALSLQSI